MRAALTRSAIPAGAGAIAFCALFFSGGVRTAPLVLIGTAALLVTAMLAAAESLGLVPAPRFDWASWGFFACLAGLAVWAGLSVIWSIEPDSSWQFTNRTLVYLAFAALGAVLVPLVPRPATTIADVFAALLGLVLGWALLTKAVVGLYPDYGRIARLRAPIGYWNELALLGVVAIGLALSLAVARDRRPLVRAAGVLLLFAALLVVLLTYSRANIVLAALVVVGWLALDARRVESLAALALGALPAVGVFGVALVLPGITNDGTARAQRVHDGWIFALVVVAVGAVIVAGSLALARVERRRPVGPATRARIDRVARLLLAVALVVAIALAAVFAGRIWRDFQNVADVSQGSSRLHSLGSGNRWGWWQQAWHAFVDHPGGGTGAGTFDLTNRLHRVDPLDVATEPHNTPLQFLSETGVPGLLLYLGTIGFAAAAVVRARRRTQEAAVTALGLGLGAWVLHMLIDIDWRYLAVCAPLFLVTGGLCVLEPDRSAANAPRRPVHALGAVALSLVAIYSLAAPWLAQRELGRAAAADGIGEAYEHAQRAHSRDPLSVDALLQMAASAPTGARALAAYERALQLEPLNPDAWYELGAYEWGQGNLRAAYLALDRSWGLDRRDGPLALDCSILDRARREVLGYGLSCPPLPRAERP